MVSQSRSQARPRGTLERLLEAATAEFAARGFDGAKVDRIARRAGINKAMLYYHFAGKRALYRAILADQFGRVAAAVAADDLTATPDQRLQRFIRTVSTELGARPHFPALWLRELVEEGRHLDATTFKTVGAILGILAGILEAGRQTRQFAPVSPLVVQMSVVGPLLLFAVSEPMRRRVGRLVPAAQQITRDDVVAYVERTTLAAVAMQSMATSTASRGRAFKASRAGIRTRAQRRRS
jgi:TetR/AcrR family transcriptional regulator